MNLRQLFCFHRFRMGDQSMTNIAVPEPPPAHASHETWNAYFRSLDKHPSHTQRVKWPCAKCGKVFYAHCGLDILARGAVLKEYEQCPVCQGSGYEFNKSLLWQRPCETCDGKGKVLKAIR